MRIGYLLQEGVPGIREDIPSGPANHVIQVIRELQKAGHRVTLLAKLDNRIWRSDDTAKFAPVIVRQMDRGAVRLVESAFRRIQSELSLPYANFFDSLRFASACRQELADCDIFFERMGWMGYGGALAARWLKIPLVLEVNGDHLDEFKSRGISIRKCEQHLSYFLMKKTASCAAHIVATGEGWRQRFVERWQVSPSKVSIVENGSALVEMLHRGDLRAFSDEAGMDDRIHLAYCGGFDPWHGIPILVRAVKKAIDLGCNLQVTLIGSGPELGKTKNLIQSLELGPYFTMTGQMPLKKAAGILAKSDIGVSPYCGRVEYSGLKLLDYKAAGLATIASGANGQPSVLDHGRTGWIIPPGDEDSLANGIIHLSKNHHLRKQIGAAARREAESLHGWRNTAGQLANILKKVLVSAKSEVCI